MSTLVIKDKRSKTVESHLVPRKGEESHAIGTLLNVLNQFGYKEIILKSDQEPAILKLKEAVKREFGNNQKTEDSPVGEHQSNGFVENAIKRVQGQIRTNLDALESRYTGQIENSDIIPWLIRNSGNLITRYHIGGDG